MRCSIEGCDGVAKTRGWCQAHYMRWRTTGDTGDSIIVRRSRGRTCSIPHCEKPSDARGWCNGHYLRWRKTGDPVAPIDPHGANWTGEEASYGAVHIRLRVQRGRASAQTCRCGEPAAQWAYDHSDPKPKYNEKSQPYSPDLTRYVALCMECHRRMDAERTRTQGCSVLGCDGKHKARGLCGKHYQQWRAAAAL